MHRLIIAVVAALCLLPAAAQARPGFVPPSSSTPGGSADKRSPDVHYGHPHTSIKLDQVSPDARYGVPDATTPSVVAVPGTEVVKADAGVDWVDAIIGGGGALILTAALGGAGLAIRPRRASASG